MQKTQVLIVDDDNDTAILFSIVLTMVGFNCSVVNTARAALAHLASNEPEMILLDMRLGLEVSGNDILYQIRSNPRFDQMRVIVITAYPQMADPISDLADLVLLKPVDIEELGHLIARFTNIPSQPYAFKDPLTDLDMLKFFLSRIELAVERTKRRKDFVFALVALAFEAKPIEGEQLQEEERELLMKAVANRLRAGFRPTDTFGRLDKERIIALFEDLKDPDDVNVILKRLHKQLDAPYQVGNQTHEVSFSIGAVLNDISPLTVDSILKAAGEALDIARCSPEVEDYLLRN